MKNDMPKEVITYRGFVLGLFQRLVAENQSRITFRYGYSPERQRLHVVLSAVALVVAIVAFVVAAFSDGLHQEDNGWIAYVLILLFIGMLSGVLWKSVTGGQKPFKPDDIPAGALPPAPKK
jgi:di/tricarboxylate transporter